MARIQSVKFNFVMNSILTVSAMIFPIITYPYVTGILGPQGIGTVSFANSVVTYFSMFAQLGIPTYGIRACAKVRDNREELSRVTQEILIINLITCVISYVLFFITVQAVPQLREEKTLYLVMSTMIFFNSIGAEWLYKGMEQYHYITLRSVLFKFIALVGMFLLIHQPGDYVIYGGITIFASVGSNLLNLINLKWLVDVRPVGNYNFRRHLRPIFVFFAMSIATTVYTNMDNVMLGFLKGTTENGYYDAAVKIKNILVGVVASLGTVLLPRVSYYVEQGAKQAFARMTERALRFVFLVSVPLCLYFILFARPSIYLLSGEAFEASILPMQLIMPTLVFIGLSNIMGIQILVPTGREKQVLYSEIAGAVVNVIVNSMLIPNLGAAGAAIGTVLAEITVLAVQVMALKGEILPALGKIPYLRTCVAVAGATAAVWWLMGSSLHPLVVLMASAVLFFSAYGVLLLLMGERMAREIWSQVWEKTVGKVLKK
ncbi:flippase [Pseudoflavonifractor sp. An85]|uniref:flippase n=1 Tax=Pseudoflavonifractor sp. An85 TaxID=1965661 RepID=UPI000B38A6B3|nr:flippase [Pseudoflavonifractor sp. An85]OUN25717.1 flippase [Pseudoflavonifractor sp. An85]